MGKKYVQLLRVFKQLTKSQLSSSSITQYTSSRKQSIKYIAHSSYLAGLLHIESFKEKFARRNDLPQDVMFH